MKISLKSDVVAQIISVTDRLKTQVISHDFDQLNVGIIDIETVKLAFAAKTRYFDKSRQPSTL